MCDGGGGLARATEIAYLVILLLCFPRREKPRCFGVRSAVLGVKVRRWRFDCLSGTL